MVFFFLAKTSKSWSCSSWVFPKLPKLLSFSSWVFPKLPKLLSFSSWFSPKLSKLSKLCSSYSWFFLKLHGCGLFLPSWNFEVVVFLFMVFFKVPIFFLAIPSKPWSSSSWIFPKFPKLLFCSLFFPKLHGRGLLVLLLVTGQHAHCLIQLFDYL